MRKIIFAVSVLAIFLTFLYPTFAAVKLNPGTTTFTYQPIFLYNVTDDSGSTPLGIDATVGKLKIFWDAYFCNSIGKGACIDTVDKSVGVTCYFDCVLQKGDVIDTKCADKTKCQFAGIGAGSCTISNPSYLSKTQNGNSPVNNITCKFYDSENPGLGYAPYPNRSFYASSFGTKVSDISATVGEEFIIPVRTTNLGMFSDSYNVRITTNKPDLVYIATPNIDTEKLTYGKVALTSENLRFLYADSMTLNIFSKSSIGSATNFDTTCTSDADCAYLTKGSCNCPDLEGSCASKVCWVKNEVNVIAQNASMPEFGLFGFLQIIILAAAALFLKRKL